MGLTPSPGLCDRLITAYTEPQRHYHTLQHLAECIGHFDAAKALAMHPGEVEIALWFHDAVYDPQGKGNEQRSADWAMQALRESGADGDVTRRVEGLVMATCHDATPTAPDQQLIVDIDLAILGAPPQRFAEYDRQVRDEYRWVPDLLYRMKRKEILQGFLGRKVLFNTPEFSARFEQLARENLRSAIESLQGG